MANIIRLSDEEVRSRLPGIPAWRRVNDELTRSFMFRDFVAAFGFMSGVALLAERLSHHPNWSNVYNRVDIALSTHDVNGISDNDFQLARQIDQLFEGS